MSDDDGDELDQFARLFTADTAAAPPPRTWSLSQQPELPGSVPTATPSTEPTAAFPTRRSLAAEAARVRRAARRRKLVIAAGAGAAVVLISVGLTVVLSSANQSPGSPDALLKQPATSSADATPAPTSTPSVTPVTETAAATPTPNPPPNPPQPLSVAAPVPSAPTVTASVASQPDCTSGSATRITISYTTTNAATLNIRSSDGSVNTNLTPAASGSIPSVLYQCNGGGESYTVTVYSPSEGVTPATATVTPVPVG